MSSENQENDSTDSVAQELKKLTAKIDQMNRDFGDHVEKV